MVNVVLFGPPGAGKGTQAFRLKEHFGLVHISTGDLLRNEIKAGSELGMEASSFIDAGKLVPDNVVIGMIGEQLRKNSKALGFIFDGYPRTTVQAQNLDRLLKKYQTEISIVLSLEVDDDELMRRLLLRGKDSGRSDDTDPKIISARIREYKQKTAPLIAFYSDQGKYRAVKGTGSVEDIYLQLVLEAEKIK